MKFKFASALFVLLALALPALAQAPDPLRMAPADTNVYVQIDDIARLRVQWENDELGKYVESRMPRKEQHAAWAGLQAVMNMTGPEIIDHYFGQQLVLIGQKADDHQPAVLLSRVAPDKIELAKVRLELQPAGEAGDFTLYNTKDGKGRIALGKGWIAAADPKFSDYLTHVLTNPAGGSLADDPQFQKWTSRLPAQRTAFAFVRKPERNEYHAVALVNTGPGEGALHYVGFNPDVAAKKDKIGSARALDFGPVPAGAIAAATLNLYDPQPKDTQLVDRLLAPKTFAKDVLPRIEAPIVAFVAPVPGEQIETNPGFDVPAVGLAIRMKDPAVAAELDQIMQGALLFMNVATTQWKTDPIGFRSVQRDDVSYRIADIGAPLAQRTGRDELRSIHISYGPVGSWYVVTSQDRLFEQVLKANADPALSLAQSPLFEQLQLRADLQQPIVTALVDAKGVSQHLAGLIDYVGQKYPEVLAQAQADAPAANRHVRMLHKAIQCSKLAGFYQAATAQVNLGEDDAVQAVIQLRR